MCLQHSSDPQLQKGSMQNTATVEILLAVYNSADYLDHTLESIFSQDLTNWRLLIRDGGSSDRTPEIINAWACRYPEKIRIIPAVQKADARENFSALLENSTADYVMFCDHDDIWLPEKISESLSRMKQLEQTTGTGCPILLFSDKQVVKEDLSEISPSFFKYQQVNPNRVTFNYLLVQNVPSGCTTLMNRSLTDLCSPIPAGAVMHDHWCSLCAAAFGNIIYLDKPTVLYRQHIQNLIGIQPYGWRYCVKNIRSGSEELRNQFGRKIQQAGIFLDRFRHQLNTRQICMLEDFASLPQQNWIRRREILFRYRLLKSGWIRNFGMFLIV